MIFSSLKCDACLDIPRTEWCCTETAWSSSASQLHFTRGRSAEHAFLFFLGSNKDVVFEDAPLGVVAETKPQGFLLCFLCPLF